MIIVEGPDGGGKTTLIERILAQYPRTLQLHARASEGVSGPVPDLYEWALKDLNTWGQQPLSVYDRHPLISEYIYGPIVRGVMDPRFHTTSLRRHLARRALVIVCLPSLGAVRASVSDDRDMPGVRTHIDAIWTSYASLGACWPVATGLLYHNYERAKDLSQVFAHINYHEAHWRYHVD